MTRNDFLRKCRSLLSLIDDQEMRAHIEQVIAQVEKHSEDDFDAAAEMCQSSIEIIETLYIDCATN